MTRTEAVEALRAAFPAMTWECATLEGRILGEYRSAGFILVCVDMASETAWRAKVDGRIGTSNTHRDPAAATRGAFTKARKLIARELATLDAARRGGR